MWISRPFGPDQCFTLVIVSSGPWGPGAQPPSQPPPPPGYYPPTGPWSGPPPPPRNQNSYVKWMLGGVAILLIIAISVGVTVLVMLDRTQGDGPAPTASPIADPIASADDDGPIEIITLEPTCQDWMTVSNAMARVQENGWGDRDPSVPAAEWSVGQRGQYEAVGKSLKQTADQAVTYARQTPSRLIRELYEQFIYFARAYADSIPSYSANDNYLAQANIAASIALDSVCQSITYGSAASRAATVPAVDPPDELPGVDDPQNPTPITPEQGSTCNELIALRKKLIAATVEWVNEDPNIPATEWSPRRRALANAAAADMAAFADNLEAVGRTSANPAVQDLTSFGAVYLRAYVESISTYVAADSYLSRAGSRASNLVIAACQAADG